MNEVSWDVGRYRRCWKVEIIHHINYWEWMHWHHTPWSYFMSIVKISQAWNNRLSQLPSLGNSTPFTSFPFFFTPSFKLIALLLLLRRFLNIQTLFLKNHSEITKNNNGRAKVEKEENEHKARITNSQSEKELME